MLLANTISTMPNIILFQLAFLLDKGAVENRFAIKNEAALKEDPWTVKVH